MSRGMFPWGLRLGSPGASGDKPNVEYTGKLSPVPADATSSYARLLDKGKKPLDNATLYSGQQLEGDGVDDHVDIGDISASCKSLEITLDPATTTEGVIQLASGVSVSISSGTITTAGLSNVTAYVNSVAGTAVAAELTVLALTFDAVSCSDVQLFYNGSDYFNGSQGNVKLWTETLDIDDVVFSYANPETPSFNRPGTSLTEAGLVERWPLIEGSGDTAYDWSGNAHHGVLTGFTDVQTAWDNAAGLSDPRVCQTALMSWGMGSNLLLDSAELTTANWSVSGGVTASQEPTESPLGVVWNKVTNDGTYTWGALTQSLPVSDGEHTISCLCKEGDYDSFMLRIYDSTAGVSKGRVTFTWVAGELTVGLEEFSGAGTVEDVGDGVWVANFTSSALIGVNTNQFKYYPTPLAVTAESNQYVANFTMLLGDTRSATTITHATPATNALTPIRTREDTNQFTREYNELNWNGRSYADAGDGPDVNPSTAVIIECVFSYHANLTGVQGYITTDSIGVVKLYPYYNDRLYFSVKLADGSNCNIGVRDGVAKLIEGQEYHLIVGYSKDTEMLFAYLNGVSNVYSSLLPSSWQNLYSTTTTRVIASNTGNDPDYALLGQLPLFRMITDAAAQKIIDKGLDAWVAKRYAKAQSKYNLGE